MQGKLNIHLGLKMCSKLEIQRECLYPGKGISKKPTANILINGEILKAFPLRLVGKGGCNLRFQET